ncbi:MAG: TetR/AcrR family transcriptional regulator [Balneolaceae bacterium]|nr:TetR/AcrR family transcriptional regulator [Balneolaceae bacterium]
MDENKDISLKRRILDASQELIVDGGYQNLSLRKIARKIGVSATSIYLHFDNKDHLIHTLMEKSIDKLNRQLMERAREIENPVSRLEALARTYIEFALENPREYQIIYLVSSDAMTRYPKEKFREARRGYEVLTRTIEEGVQSGLMEEDNPRLASYSFWAQLHGVMSVVLSRRLDNRIDRDEFIEQSLEQIVDGFHIRTAAVR